MDIFRLEKGGAVAEGFPVKGASRTEFVVMAGSTARVPLGLSDRDGQIPKLRQKLINDDILASHAKQDDLLIFVQNFRFTSPTAAGNIINGANLSGVEPWLHISTGQSLKDWLP